MGCNCGKGKTKASTTAAPRPTNIVPSKKAPTTSGSTIGPTSGRTQTFTLLLDSGRTTSFGSRLEAQAALVRSGGFGSIS
jgi:hypothetical protein